MATEEEGEASTVFQDVDANLNSFGTFTAIDVSENYALLGSRKGLILLDLENPYQPAQTLFFPSRFDVGVVKWSPHSSSVAASTSNKSTLIWNVEDDSHPLTATLRRHQHLVTDVSWSPINPSVLVTSSIDSYIYLWDTRAPAEPVQSFHVQHRGAHHVQWNRVNHSLLASAHEKEVRIWDTRRAGGAEPALGGGAVATFTAHTQQITGLDWSSNNANRLVTCSLDKTVKLWAAQFDGAADDDTGAGATIVTGEGDGGMAAVAILQREQPLQSVLFTPFGEGLITTSRGIGEDVDAPQTVRLWSLSNADEIFAAVHAYGGPRTRILGTCWRVVGDRLFQLVSLDKSQHLRLHRVRPAHLRACGYAALDDLYRSDEVTADQGPRVVTATSKISLGALRADLVPTRAPTSALGGSTSAAPGSLWREALELDSLAGSAALPGLVLDHLDLKGRIFRCRLSCRQLVEPVDMAEDDTEPDDLGLNLEADEQMGRSDSPPRFNPAAKLHRSLSTPVAIVATVSLQITFPHRYPLFESPSFAVSGELNSSPLDIATLEGLRKLAETAARRALILQQPCLVDCIRALHAGLVRRARAAATGGGWPGDGTVSAGVDSTQHTVAAAGGLLSSIPSVQAGVDLTSVTEAVNPADVGGAATPGGGGRAAIPCPRLFGASFSAGGTLTVFATGNLWPRMSAGGTGGNATRPRTYAELLECSTSINGRGLAGAGYGAKGASHLRSGGLVSSTEWDTDDMHTSGSDTDDAEVDPYSGISNSMTAYDSPSSRGFDEDGRESSTQSSSVITKRGALVPWAPRPARVLLVDLSDFLPGSTSLAAAYALGHWRIREPILQQTPPTPPIQGSSPVMRKSRSSRWVGSLSPPLGPIVPQASGDTSAAIFLSHISPLVAHKNYGGGGSNRGLPTSTITIQGSPFRTLQRSLSLLPKNPVPSSGSQVQLMTNVGGLSNLGNLRAIGIGGLVRETSMSAAIPFPPPLSTTAGSGGLSRQWDSTPDFQAVRSKTGLAARVSVPKAPLSGLGGTMSHSNWPVSVAVCRSPIMGTGVAPLGMTPPGFRRLFGSLPVGGPEQPPSVMVSGSPKRHFPAPYPPNTGSHALPYPPSQGELQRQRTNSITGPSGTSLGLSRSPGANHGDTIGPGANLSSTALEHMRGLPAGSNPYHWTFPYQRSTTIDGVIGGGGGDSAAPVLDNFALLTSGGFAPVGGPGAFDREPPPLSLVPLESATSMHNMALESLNEDIETLAGMTQPSDHQLSVDTTYVAGGESGGAPGASNATGGGLQDVLLHLGSTEGAGGGSGELSPETAAAAQAVSGFATVSMYCRQNAYVASKLPASQSSMQEAGDVAEVWQLLAESCEAEACEVAAKVTARAGREELYPWRHGAFGQRLTRRIADHYGHTGDVQTCATLLCVLGCAPQYPSGRDADVEPVGGQLLPWGAEQHDRCLSTYADLLYVWGAHERRLEVLKHRRKRGESGTGMAALQSSSFVRRADEGVGGAGSSNSSLEVAAYCSVCRIECDSSTCARCGGWAMHCSVCQQSVKGLSTVCVACAHGGHTLHMEAWFRDHDMCPTGCGCNCTEVAKRDQIRDVHWHNHVLTPTAMQVMSKRG